MQYKIKMENIIQTFDQYQEDNPVIISVKLEKASRNGTLIIEPFDSEEVESREINDQSQTKKIIEELEKQYIFQKLKKTESRHQSRLIKSNIFKNRTSLRQNFISQKEKQKKQIQILAFQKQIKIISQRESITTPVPLLTTFNLVIKKQQQGFFQNPIYKVFNSSNNKFLMAAQKTTGFCRSSYLITTNKNSVSERQKCFLGKISSNFFLTEWIMYDDGFNPDKVRDLSQCRKQLLYIEYQKNIFGIKGPRKMKVGIPGMDEQFKPRIIRPFKNENLIQQKFSEKSTNLLFYKNMDPVYDQKLNTYKLFKDDSNKYAPEVYHPKNFILMSDENSDPLIYFIVKNENEYYLEMNNPFSILQAFGICLTNLENKLLTQ